MNEFYPDHVLTIPNATPETKDAAQYTTVNEVNLSTFYSLQLAEWFLYSLQTLWQESRHYLRQFQAMHNVGEFRALFPTLILRSRDLRRVKVFPDVNASNDYHHARVFLGDVESNDYLRADIFQDEDVTNDCLRAGDFLGVFLTRVYRRLLYFRALCFPCLSRYLTAFQEKGVQTVRTLDCHNDAGHLDRQKFHHKQEPMQHGAPIPFFHTYIFVHSYYGYGLPSIQNTLDHCKKYWNFLYLHAPKIAERLFRLYCSYQHLLGGVGRLPGVQARGHLSLSDYNIGQAL